ncbi:hypothetical protein J6590_060992 [Homalodisca vitripennis]|nr:hypothetical protein J6590_060992 [Homalodisca vitripennis]
MGHIMLDITCFATQPCVKAARPFRAIRAFPNATFNLDKRSSDSLDKIKFFVRFQRRRSQEPADISHSVAAATQCPGPGTSGRATSGRALAALIPVYCRRRELRLSGECFIYNALRANVLCVDLNNQNKGESRYSTMLMVMIKICRFRPPAIGYLVYGRYVFELGIN